MPISARGSSTPSRGASGLAQKARRWLLPAKAETPKGSERAAYLDVPPFEEWCRYIDILPKAGGKIAFAPEAWGFEQRELNARRTGHDLVVKSRQVWISTLELARDLYTPLKYPGTNTLVIVHEEDAARKFDAVLTTMMHALDRAGRLPPIETDRVGEIVFASTGSTLRVTEAGATEHTAAKKGRAGSLYRVHGSEIAFWRQAATTLQAARGTTPVEEIYESTTNGASGAFYELVQAAREGRGEYTLHFFAWWQHEEYRRRVPADFDPRPRDEWEDRLRGYGCDDEQIAWWRAKVDDPTSGLERTLEEFPVDVASAFRAGGGQYIDAATCDWLAQHVRAPLREIDLRGGKLRIYEEPSAANADEKYIAGGDVAEGLGPDGDASTWDVINRRTGLTVATWWSNTTEPSDMALAGAEIGKLYNHALLAPERNKDGATVIATLEREAKYRRIYRHDDDRLGWPTNAATRPPLFDDQAAAWRGKTLPTPDARVASEARTLTRVAGKPQARGKGSKGGARDDAFVARAIATQVRQRTMGGTFKSAQRGESMSEQLGRLL